MINGTTSQAAALSQVGVRPGFGWITGTPHGNEPAGGEGSVKELYDLAARTDCANAQRLSNLDVFIQPVTAPDDRDHNTRTTAWSFDPNRDRGTIQMPENAQLFDNAVQYPGLFFIDAHQQSSGYFFPPNEDAALHEISHFALDLINDVIGPSIQQTFNDQSAQYRNYNTYDLFVPEYGDTVPALLMGGAGMTYEKGTNENYGKQVYDHYLAMDETVTAVAEEKTRLMTDWVKQWQEAVDQGSACKLQDNTQVAPTVIDLLDIGQVAKDQDPNASVCGYYFLPGAHSGDVAQTMKDLQRAGVNVYRLTAPLTIAGAHRFGNFNVTAVQGSGSPVLTETSTLPVGTLYVPLDQPTKHWIQAVMGENPYLPFHYFYDQVTWSYSLLRGFAGNGFLTQQPPAATPMTLIGDPGLGSAPVSAQPVYAFNTDSLAGLALVNQLLGQGATVSRGGAAFDAGGTHFLSGAALVDGGSVSLATITADALAAQTPVYGLAGYPVAHYAVALPKIGVYTGATTAPTNPAFHGTSDGFCTNTAYCEVMFDLTARGGHPDLADRADHVDRPRERRARQPGLHGVHQPELDDRDRHRSDRAAGLRQRRRPLHRLARRRPHQRSQRRPDDGEHEHDQRDHDARLDLRRYLGDDEPGRLGLRRRRLDLPRGEQRSQLRPDHARRERHHDPGGDGGVELRALRRLRWPGRLGQLLRLRRQRQLDAAGTAGRDRPTVRRRARGAARLRRLVPGLDDGRRAGRPQRRPLPGRRGDPGLVTRQAGRLPSWEAPRKSYGVIRIATSYFPTDVRVPGVSPVSMLLRISSPRR